MNMYRYKNYDFVNDRLPLGFPWKEPQVFAASLPDSDYEVFEDSEYSKEFIKSKYYVNEANGKDMTFEVSATIVVLVEEGLVSATESNDYSVAVRPVLTELTNGFFHSAYYEALQVDMSSYSPSVVQVHNDVVDEIRDYVNDKYPPQFAIPI